MNFSAPFFKSFSTPPLNYWKASILIGTVGLGQWFFNDFFHPAGGGAVIAFSGVGLWWLLKPVKSKFDAPTSLHGWIKRCKEVLAQFEALEKTNEHFQLNHERANSIDKILKYDGPQRLIFVGSKKIDFLKEKQFTNAIEINLPLDISYSLTPSIKNKPLTWPKKFHEQEALIYVLSLPLSAEDLLWIQEIPDYQNGWIMVLSEDEKNWLDQLNSLKAQLPERWKNRYLRFSLLDQNLPALLKPVRNTLKNPKRNFELTRINLLARLHRSWQSDLEILRRNKFSSLQQRNQWMVAGAVFASPFTSTDLLSVTVINGLMIQEMAKIWSCKWSSDSLKAIAKQLTLAALAQGVVEWSGQTLLGAAKLHGGSWIAAGSLQAISAAYLTRVVGRSIADFMALNNGVSEPDLELLKLQAPKIVASAVDQERIDWGNFIMQSKEWVDRNPKKLSSENAY